MGLTFPLKWFCTTYYIISCGQVLELQENLRDREVLVHDVWVAIDVNESEWRSSWDCASSKMLWVQSWHHHKRKKEDNVNQAGWGRSWRCGSVVGHTAKHVWGSRSVFSTIAKWNKTTQQTAKPNGLTYSGPLENQEANKTLISAHSHVC